MSAWWRFNRIRMRLGHWCLKSYTAGLCDHYEAVGQNIDFATERNRFDKVEGILLGIMHVHRLDDVDRARERYYLWKAKQQRL